MSGYMENVATLDGHLDRVWHVAWNPSGSLLASCGGDKTVRIWGKKQHDQEHEHHSVTGVCGTGTGEDVGTNWVCKAVLQDGHSRTVRRVSWSPCGNLLASASFDGTTSIWNRKNGDFECVTTLEGHENEVKSVTWAPSGSLLATCSRDKSVWIWEVDHEDDDYQCVGVVSVHTQDVKNVSWHPHKEILASCSYDNTIKLFQEDDDDWSCMCTLSGHESTVWGITFDKTGTRLASCSDDNTVKIWQEFNNKQGDSFVSDFQWKCVCTLSGYHTRTIYDVDWCKQSGMLATCSGDESIHIFQEGNNEEFISTCCTNCAHAGDVNAVRWNPDGSNTLASAGDDNVVKLWKYIPN